MDARFDHLFDLTAPGLFCDPRAVDLPDGRGTGFYANQVTNTDEGAPDPQPALRTSRVPALVLKGECDYLPWSFASEYRDTLPDAELVYLPGAGHEAYIERSETYFPIVRTFLLDHWAPVPPYEDDAPPRDYRGPL